MSKTVTREYDHRGNVKSVSYHGFSKHKNCATYIVTAAARDAANQALEALGWPGPDNFNVQLKDLLGQVTHYGCFVRLTDTQKSEWDAALKLLAIKEHKDKTEKEYSDDGGLDIKPRTRPR